jgi:hypothetical protein
MPTPPVAGPPTPPAALALLPLAAALLPLAAALLPLVPRLLPATPVLPPLATTELPAPGARVPEAPLIVPGVIPWGELVQPNKPAASDSALSSCRARRRRLDCLQLASLRIPLLHVNVRGRVPR